MSKFKRKGRRVAPQLFGLDLRNSAENIQRSITDEAEKKVSPGILLLCLMLVLMGLVGAAVTFRRSPKSGSLLAAVPMQSPPSLPSNVPSREFVYSGGSLVSTVEPFRLPPSDIGVWRPSDGTWYLLDSQNQGGAVPWGANGDTPVPGDFDGDGKTDFSVYRPNEGKWYIYCSSDGSYLVVTWGGAAGDKPTIGDFDGDGRSDLSIFRPSDQNWYIIRSSDGQGLSVNWGASTDTPLAADFDGDGYGGIVSLSNGSVGNSRYPDF
jgi:hypothetical protein